VQEAAALARPFLYMAEKGKERRRGGGNRTRFMCLLFLFLFGRALVCLVGNLFGNSVGVVLKEQLELFVPAVCIRP